MIVIARLEFELTYYDSAVYRFNHYTLRTPPEFLVLDQTIVLQVDMPLKLINQSVSHFRIQHLQNNRNCLLKYFLKINPLQLKITLNSLKSVYCYFFQHIIDFTKSDSTLPFLIRKFPIILEFAILIILLELVIIFFEFWCCKNRGSS